ncbi:NAD(P)-dependent dehydrogenase, short-chain alcohol dehydrogenase family [Litchfieldia salsa]|uniref:NAD(P)-dependent dehydrogenase, short-chain alcohol dehydrogenase family n=1 Tax=Litchfieldia salsa TaxID=930152 RepID=A0A1H0QA85_9BACI|nr:NAD(P)-dependent dehydrogenase, short-chain alcohol dehydrogenase family [Litchfieldia salsa]
MLKDKIVIVTGGSNGMGKAMAKRFARDGAFVTISGRDPEKLNKAKEEIETFEGQVLPVVMDVRDIEKVQSMIDQTKQAFGTIDYLVNNAAGNFLVRAEDLSPNGWRAVIDIVLNGTWNCTQAVAKDWIKEKKAGSITNIVATYAWTAGVGVVHSASAKAGVLAMTRSLAVEWGSQYGIRLNAIAPGPIEETGGVDKLILDDEAAKRVLDGIPLNRFGKVDEVANLAAFLFSQEAQFINGDCITIDGGQWLNGSSFKY